MDDEISPFAEYLKETNEIRVFFKNRSGSLIVPATPKNQNLLTLTTPLKSNFTKAVASNMTKVILNKANNVDPNGNVSPPNEAPSKSQKRKRAN